MSNTYQDQIIARLRSDTTATPVFMDGTPLSELLPGGVISIEEPGRKGLNRIKYAAGFDAQIGLLKPLAVVLEVKEQATGEAVDSTTGFETTKATELIWIYAQGDKDEEGNDPFEDIITPAYNRIYRLLHTWRLQGGFQVLWRGDTVRDKHEPDLNNAAFFIAPFVANGFRKFV